MVKSRDRLSNLKILESKGFTVPELMITVAIVGIMIVVGATILLNLVRYWRVQVARANVQQNSRSALDLVNRTLRQASASTVLVSQRTNQPPYSWITFSIDKGTGPALGDYGFYQEGKNLRYMKDGSTTTIAENLRYLAFSYPRTDDSGIISVSLTFEEATYSGYTKALQLSIEKVRVMN
ncbi:MAG: hypothetical protein A3I11_05945 [Elusimicrobia bacterium RIFCSPLOWO2_02_FULL_39_32]|nr:MAG: hypothetical protein A2034_03575 [Elusimicrobia bacterium GWA2_38_7]OGR80677.1 MAG: hypothetical protein A3B80_04125 [Elusimicrobia bacterium RIFCSPHIGHO2_02_FULL_39_36]OGR91525.1 MAG: hypothetical protein A3I11_05945 [Elusimicrobia bacterium RIFCSPLOWO2_02_FULL_39_32]OGS00780.1 MAG: hypothetical protein A3G85_04545 [Elusimicrobia bacterium RIFCSPLOWO2_12_FULL_39_28]